MNWGIYGIIIIFGLFVLLMIINPKLSCFGRWIKSPLYPLFRKKTRKIKTDDYGFHLVDESPQKQIRPSPQKKDLGKGSGKEKKTEDYGFHLD